MTFAQYVRKNKLRVRWQPWGDVLKLALTVVFCVWFFARGAGELDYNWQWRRVPRYLFSYENGQFTPGPLLLGVLVTLKASALSLVLAFAFGLSAALFRMSRSFAAGLTAKVYVEAIRNTPLLIQIFFTYFVLGPVLGIGRFTSAVLALSLFEGAYASEIIRAGIASIPAGQWEAAHSLGLSSFHTYTRVILPQAMQRVLPPLTSQGVSLIKDSSLISTIAIYDLTMQGQVIVADTFLTFEIWFTVAGVYLMMTGSLSLLAKFLDNRLKGGNAAC